MNSCFRSRIILLLRNKMALNVRSKGANCLCLQEIVGKWIN